MQRILSVQTSRNADRGSSEFVTKRLCCSFLFSVAFLSLLGGFLLGRYATDRALLLRNAALQHRLQHEENYGNEMLNNLTTTIDNINESISRVHILDVNAFVHTLNCTDSKRPDIATLAANLMQTNIAWKTSSILNAYLKALSSCFGGINAYLDGLNPSQHITANKTLTSD